MDRRSFLRSALAGAGVVALGDTLWRVAWPAAGDAPASSYGALGPADAEGLQYPSGFSGRLVARSGLPVGTSPSLHPVFPDGAACFPRPGGAPGWILVVNSEFPPGTDYYDLPVVQDTGGVAAIVFDGDADVVDSYWILRGSRTNCAGGPTPWGTWLTCEEYDQSLEFFPGAAPSDAGRVFECDPGDKAAANAREIPALGRFKHEAATFDAAGRVYLTEDVGDGLLYRYTPPAGTAGTPASLTGGTLEAAVRNGDGTVGWVGPIDATATTTSTRVQGAALGATTFQGGEGCFHANGVVLVTTKGDDRVWAITVDAEPNTFEILYDGDGGVLNGVDNVIVSPHTGNIYVAEDGDNMEVVVIETDPGTGARTVAPLIRATGPQHGSRDVPNPTPLPLVSEITGLALSPDGRRLYFNSQRGFVLGATYEVTAPAPL